jgi:hypothetical protein
MREIATSDDRLDSEINIEEQTEIEALEARKFELKSSIEQLKKSISQKSNIESANTEIDDTNSKQYSFIDIKSFQA